MGSVSGNNTTPLSPVLLQNEIRTSEFDALRSSTPSPSSPTLHVGPRGTTRITRGRCRLARPRGDLQLLSFASFPGALRLGSSAVVRHNALMLQHCLRKQTLCRRDCGPLGAQQLTSGRGQCGEIDSRRAVDRSHPADHYDLAFDLNRHSSDVQHSRSIAASQVMRADRWRAIFMRHDRLRAVAYCFRAA
jgi:hypothetical protein